MSDRDAQNGHGHAPADGSPAKRDADRNLILGALQQADAMAVTSMSVGGLSISGDKSSLTPAHRTLPVGRGAARSRAIDLPPGFFAGFDVLREVHRGGQGVVFEAVERDTGDRVAIKLLHGGAATSKSARTRFEREVAVLEQLEHPGIVKVRGSGATADGSFYYIMDYIAGESLDVVLRRLRPGERQPDPDAETVTSPDTAAAAPTRTATHASRSAAKSSSKSIAGRIGPSRASNARTRALTASDPELRRLLELFAEVCDAVSAAHMRGVIHRDLKPANIRLETTGAPILVDFGLVKLDGSDSAISPEHSVMTETGQFVGSMPWASPEQAAGEHASVDVRSDVYSLGVILYQMITGGRFPYRVVGSVREVLDAILYDEPTRPSDWGRRIGDELETITLKALSKPRERRYQSAGEFARDIRRYLAGEPIEAKRDSGWYVLTKTVSRHKAPASAAAVLLLAGTVFSVVVGAMNTELRAANEQVSQSLGRERESFDEVRELVRTFMYDFNDEIEHLRGASNARRLVLENALKYLDLMRERLIDDAGGPAGDRDWELLAEVAEAHDRVGDLYAAPYAASLGESDEAGKHYEESRRLREALLAARPDDSSVLIGLAENREKMAGWLQRTGRFAEAADMAIEAKRRFEQALGIAPQSFFAAAGSARSIGLVADIHRRLVSGVKTLDEARAEADLALEAYTAFATAAQQLIERGTAEQATEPENDPRRMLAMATVERGITRLQLARRIESIREREKDAQLAEVLAAEGRAEIGLGLEDTRLGLTLVRELAAQHPDTFAYQRTLFGALYALGLSYERLAPLGADPDARAEHYAAALESYRLAEAVTLQLSMDASNLEAQRDHGLVLSRLMSVLTETQSFGEASAVGAEMVSLRRGLARADRIPRHERDLAVALFKLGDLEKMRALGAEATASLDHWLAARDWFTQCREVFIGLEAQGVPVAGELEDLETTLAEADEAIANLSSSHPG
jgi:serine/threonine protein kinase